MSGKPEMRPTDSNPAKAQQAEVQENEIEYIFRGFSCPQEGLDEGFLGLVAVTYARKTTRLFLSHYAAELTCRGHGLVGFLEKWLNHDMSFEMVWDPAIGNTFRAIQVGKAAEAVNDALALRVSASGVSGQWSLALVEPVRLQWSRWLLPTADRIAVNSGGKAESVHTRLGDTSHEVNFTCTEGGWQADGAETMLQFGTQHKKIIVLPAAALAAEGCGFGRIVCARGLAHQYLNLLCRLGPVDDGTDTNFYYSPVIRKERPLSRIVVAYHAFANTLLFYRLCRRNGIADEGYCAQREAELVSQVDQLESPLRTNEALTSVGRGLCDPLIERLQS